MASPDRIEALHQTNLLVGLDFVYVFPDQQTLAVFFYPALSQTAQQILGPISPQDIRIHSPSGGERLPVVPLDPATPPSWITIDGRRVLRVRTTEPGDFSLYSFRLDHVKVDPYFPAPRCSIAINCRTNVPPIRVSIFRSIIWRVISGAFGRRCSILPASGIPIGRIVSRQI
jgi:hypothetical protein